jgi:hypothetical protein
MLHSKQTAIQFRMPSKASGWSLCIVRLDNYEATMG